MKSSRIKLYGAVVLAAIVPMACMASGGDASPAPVRPNEDTPSALDGEAPDADFAGEPDGAVEAPPCSAAGWCTTVLPDVDLVMKDIAVFPSRAVAVAESPTFGIKVLEWLDAEARWRYIDDGTQNGLGIANAAEQFVGKIWMPNENEIYYGVSRAIGYITIPAYIYHGTRGAQDTWSWTHDFLASSDNGNAGREPTLGFWGTSQGDVYVWFNDTIYRRTSVDGEPREWIAEYTADDVDFGTEKLFFFDAAGTSADDIWFAGARVRRSFGTCALLLRKTSNVYRRVADGAILERNRCTARSGTQLIGGAEGGLTDIHALGPRDFVALKGGHDVVRIQAEGELYSIAIASVPTILSPGALNSLSAVDGDLWLGGIGRVVRGKNVWDGGAFGLSTVWPNGAPITKAIWQVKGTSNTNLWAIGVRNALHKTTP